MSYWSVRTQVARMLANVAAAIDGDSTQDRLRQSPYDELYVISALAKKYPGVDGGEYRVASMGPQATALQLGISANIAAAAAALLLGNSGAGNSPAKRCYLDYIRFLVTTPPTSGTELLVATSVDSKDRTPTTVSNGTGGTGPGTPATATCYRAPVVDPNMDNPAPAVLGVPYFPMSTAVGAPPAVPAGGPNVRVIVGNLSLRAQIPVASDEYIIDFGSSDAPASGALVTAAPAGASRVVCSHPGVVIGSLQWFILQMWSPSNVTAGIAFKGLDMGWWER